MFTTIHSWLDHNPTSGKDRRRRRPRRLSFEALDDRLTPAVGINAGALEIVGGAMSDYAMVWESNEGYEAFVHVNLNGAVTHYQKVLLPKGIKFDGKGGDDSLFNTASVVVQAKGGAGNDYLEGGPGKDMLNGGDDNDTLVGKAGNDRLDGGAGNDSIDGGTDVDSLYGASGNDVLIGGDNTDSLRGGAGNDTLDGGDGKDVLFGEGNDDSLLGGAGKDVLDGSDGDDVLFGGSEDDTLYGRVGNDRLQGDDGNDTLIGHQGNDQLFGGEDNDRLEGREDNDDLYGEDGDDRVYGGSGNDGLCGGLGINDVRDSSGADRFLILAQPSVDEFWELRDLKDDDAGVVFVSGNDDNGGKSWTNDEVEAVDTALALLHHDPLTQGTQLLKRSDGSALIFARYAAMDPDAVPEGYEVDPDEIGAFNPGLFRGESSQISVFDFGFEVGIKSTIAEVIGIDWASQSANGQWDEFKAVSGWTQDKPGPWGPGYESSQGGWYYVADSGFVNAFAHTNPVQDWAATFAYYFLNGSTHDNADVQAKLDLVGSFLTSLAE
jgi:Ca2+-binding RTX toxin-like protein